MSRGLAGTGVEVPAWAVRAALGVLLLALATFHLGDLWGWIAALAGLAAGATPWAPAAWIAMLSLAGSELVQPAGAAAWHPYVLLAGLGLAQVIAARAVTLPPRALVELRVFRRPLVVAAAIVAPCEGLLALALWLRGAALPSWLPATAIGALALLAIGALLFGRVLRSAE